MRSVTGTPPTPLTWGREEVVEMEKQVGLLRIVRS